MRYRAWSMTVVLLALTATACSVTTPRNESASVNRVDGGAGVGGASDTVTTEGSSDGSVSSPGAVSGSSAAGASSSPTARRSGGAPGTAGARTETATASSTGAVPGVTKDSIKVSIIAGYSGPLAAVIAEAYEAMETWQEDVNQAGGIHGRKVVLEKVDHKETADGGVAACKETLSNGSFFAMVPEGIEANLTAISCLDAAGMPTLYFAATTDPAWRRAFSDMVTSAQGGYSLASYTRTLGADKKVGVMYVNQPAYKSAADAFIPEAKRLGVNVGSVQAVEPNQASFTSQLLRMKEDNVQILVISATTEAIGILRDARSMAYTPVFTGWGYLFDFVTESGRNLFDGVTGVRGYATVDSPAYAKYAARMQDRGRGRDRTADLEGFPTYGRALLLGEMIRRAGPNPTRESLVAGAETIKNFDTGILPPITYGPGDHLGSDAVFGSVCCNSDYTWKGQGPARVTFS